MNAVDYVIIAIVVISSLLSLRRGFTVEAFSLAAWIAAFVIGRVFSTPLAYVLTDYLDPPSAREPVAFATLFIATLVVAALIKRLLREVINASGLTTMDRVLGMAFGALRGVILVIFGLGLLSRLFELDGDRWWRESLLIPHLMLIEDWTYNTANSMWQKIMAIN
ncbi:MAG: CvpA family protein [Ketobacteraceae bacterium]|nr:CvpA family protein [Ketobacteraceae bacterium]